VTSRERVATLAALFAPDRAAAILGRLSAADAPEAVARAAALATAPRRERLLALSAALAREGEDAPAHHTAAAALERPRVAAVLRRVAAGGDVASPLLRRLCRERLGR
jgi:hypothetical protein